MAVPTAQLSESSGEDGARAEHVEEGDVLGQRLHRGILRAYERRVLPGPGVRLLRFVQRTARLLYHLLEHAALSSPIKGNDPGAVPRSFDKSHLRTLFIRPTFGV